MSENEEMNVEELDNIIVLTDDEGNDVEFEWLDTLEMNRSYPFIPLARTNE